MEAPGNGCVFGARCPTTAADLLQDGQELTYGRGGRAFFGAAQGAFCHDFLHSPLAASGSGTLQEPTPAQPPANIASAKSPASRL